MNHHDLDYACQRFGDRTPNRLRVSVILYRFARWADDNSDGWMYWPKPRRAARKAMELVQSTTSAANDAQERHDCSNAEMRAALAPIKAFMTRQGLSSLEELGL